MILWSSASGLYGGITASLTDISPDTKMDQVYYQRPLTSDAILTGRIDSPRADTLRNALASRVASTR